MLLAPFRFIPSLSFLVRQTVLEMEMAFFGRPVSLFRVARLSPVGHLSVLLSGRLPVRPLGRLSDRLLGRLSDRPIGRLPDRLLGHLSVCLLCHLSDIYLSRLF